MMQFLLAAGLGAAAAYFFDPQAGNSRRIRFRDQAFAAFRRGSRRAEGVSEDAANRTRGLFHEVGEAVRPEPTQVGR